MSNIEKIKGKTMLQTTNAWVTKLSSFASASNLNFTDYQKEIVVNTVRKIQEEGLDIYDYDTNNVADVLYQTAFLNLNPSASPRHCYFISRDVWENGKKVGKKLEVNIEGEGNDEILRKFGEGIEHIGKVMIISEYDEYQDGVFNGFDFSAPVWIKKPTPIGKKKGRVIKVIYPIRRTNGNIEYWSAERADLQPIILKHIEKNLTGYMRADNDGYRKLMKKLKDLSFDEIIEDYEDYEVEYSAYGKTNKVKLVQDSYTGSTGEAMIIRKLRNLAIRTFPKNFDKTELHKIYEKTFEEKYDKPSIAERSQTKLQIENEKEASKVEVKDEVEEQNQEDVVVILEDVKPKKVVQEQKPKEKFVINETNDLEEIDEDEIQYDVDGETGEVSEKAEIENELDDIFSL